MPQNVINTAVTILSDGWQMAGGYIKRTLKIISGDIVLAGNGLGFTTIFPQANASLGGKFGDGSDGDYTVTGSLSITRDMYYANLTVNTGTVLTTSGWKVFVSDTLTIQGGGAIAADGAAGANGGTGVGAGGSGGVGAGKNTQGTLPTGLNGGVGGGSTANGTANDPTLAGRGDTYDRTSIQLSASVGGGGSGGGAHGTSDGLQAQCVVYPYGYTGGSGGAGTGTGSTSRRGGGGGGGGAAMEIWAYKINNGGSIHSNGGKGGNGVGPTDLSGNGGGGGGGTVRVWYHLVTGSGVGTLQANGGAVGTGGNGGTAGTNGLTDSQQI